MREEPGRPDRPGHERVLVRRRGMVAALVLQTAGIVRTAIGAKWARSNFPSSPHPWSTSPKVINADPDIPEANRMDAWAGKNPWRATTAPATKTVKIGAEGVGADHQPTTAHWCLRVRSNWCRGPWGIAGSTRATHDVGTRFCREPAPETNERASKRDSCDWMHTRRPGGTPT